MIDERKETLKKLTKFVKKFGRLLSRGEIQNKDGAPERFTSKKYCEMFKRSKKVSIKYLMTEG